MVVRFPGYVGNRPIADVGLPSKVARMTIEMLLLYGALAGFIVGAAIPKPKLGCLILLTVPVVMIVYINRWQAAHPENLRSTSALDFLFGPLWPSLGAIGGFVAGMMLRSALAKR